MILSKIRFYAELLYFLIKRYQVLISFLFKSSIIPLQLLITNIQYPLDLIIGQVLSHCRLDLDDTERFCVPEHLHIFKALERIGKNILLSILVSVAAFCEYAVGLLNHKPCTSAFLIEAAEVCRDIIELHTTFCH